jgi:hypothetical protein
MLLGRGFLYAFYPVFWAMPTMILSESAAAATFGLITSVSQLGGFAGLYVIGFLNDRTHSPTAGFGFIALAYVAAGGLVLSLRIHYPSMGKRKTRPNTNCPQPFQNHSGQLKASARCRRNRSLLLESAACRELTGVNKGKKRRRRTRLGLLLSISRSSTARPNVRPSLSGLPANRHPQGGAPGQQTRFLSARRCRASTQMIQTLQGDIDSLAV